MSRKNKIAFLHRYGLEGWVCCGGHAVPGIVTALSKDAELHFFGPKTTEPENTELRSQLTVHELPYTWNRANPADKISKTLIWYFWLPLIGLRCRLKGIQLIWNDETVPFTAPILRLFYGKQIAITVMDFFARIYTEKHPHLRWLSRMVERIDFAAWRKLPLIFTKVLYTQEFLAEHGVPTNAMHLYRNPVDHEKFHPVDGAVRQATRSKFGFVESDIVLSHHGILHPNKGNNWILQRLSELVNELPNLKYLLIGDGPEMGNLKQLATQLGIVDHVVFPGWLPSEQELNNALASSDIGLVMRIGQETDHFHMTDTLAHEMACGKPILAVNLHGIAEVIEDGQNGFLFPTDKPNEFCTRLRRLAGDTDHLKNLGEAALLSSREASDITASSASVAQPLAALLNNP